MSQSTPAPSVYHIAGFCQALNTKPAEKVAHSICKQSFWFAEQTSRIFLPAFQT